MLLKLPVDKGNLRRGAAIVGGELPVVDGVPALIGGKSGEEIVEVLGLTAGLRNDFASINLVYDEL
jgi:hypothetical protein